MRTKMINRALLTSFLIVSGLSAISCSGSVSFIGKALNKGKVGVELQEDISMSDKSYSYEIDYDSELPSGLELSEQGVVSGKPEINGDFSFNIVAVKGEDFYTANFSIEIDPGELTYQGQPLPEATTGQPYVQELGSASGANKITYALKADTTLPVGLSLSASGTLSGTPEAETNQAFIVVIASAKGCLDKEASFTLKIKKGEDVQDDLGYIVYEGATLPMGEVGTAYNQSLASAYGVKGISYKIKYVNGVGLPKGLAFNSGVILGTPKDSTYKVLHFQVVASAEGYESKTADFYMQIKDVFINTSLFEAEYIYVDNLVGAGYSGSNSGKNMVQTYTNASNGHILGYLNAELVLPFEISSKETTSAKLTLGLGTEQGELIFTPNNFKIFVNNVEVDYGTITVPEDGAGASGTNFTSIDISPNINLIEGDNVISFQILKTIESGGIGTSSAKGPLFDYIKLSETTTTLGWNPKVANC